MTEDEWVQRALEDVPPMSARKRARLAALFREPDDENDPGQR